MFNDAVDTHIYDILLEISQAIGQAHTVEAALHSALAIVCQHTDWEYGEVWLPNEPSTATISSRYLYCSPVWYGQPERLAEFRAVTQAAQFAWGIGLPGRVAATQRPEWHPDVRSIRGLTFLRTEAAIAANLGAALGVPIVNGNQLLAVLVFFRSEAHDEIHSEVQLISSIAAQLGVLMELQRARTVLLQNERHLNTLIDSLPGIVFSANASYDWDMRYLSHGCLKLTGYESTELAGPYRRYSYNHITHPDDLDRVLTVIGEAITNRQPYVVEYRIRTKTGTEKWLWEKGYAVYSQAGQVRSIEGFITDITERHQAEAALREQEAFLQLILDNLPQRIFWKDHKLVYRGGNRAWQQYARYISGKDAIGKTDQDIWPAAEAARIQAVDQQVIDTNQPLLHVQMQKHLPNQTLRWQDMSKIPIHNSAGAAIGVLGVFEDITEQRQAAAAMRRREQYLAALVQAQQLLLDATPKLAMSDLYAQVLARLGQAAAASQVYLYLQTEATSRSPVQSAAPSTASSPIAWSQQAQWKQTSDPLSNPAAAPARDWPLQLDWTDWPTIWRSQLQHGDPIQVAQADEIPPEIQAWLESWQIFTLLILPLHQDGELIGCLSFISDRPWPESWGSAEIDLLKAAAAAIGLTQKHQFTQASLTAAEAKYRSIFENSVEGIFQTTTSGYYQTVNPMLAQIYGYESPADMIQNLTNIEQQLYVDSRRRQEFSARMQADGAVQGFESQVYRKDGQVIWISESARSLYDERGQLLGYEGTVEDITQRKQSELELLRRDALLEGVAKAATCLLTQTNVPKAIAEALAILGEAADADRVYIYENHPHPHTEAISMSIRFEWTAPTIPPSIDQAHWQNQAYSNFGMQRWYDAFIEHRSIRGIVSTFPAAEQMLLQQDGIQAILMVPIFLDEELWGYIGFDACREARQWNANDESILVAIAASLGGVFKRQRTEEQMRYQAFHDNLTGLPNRMLFNQHLPIVIARAKRTTERVGVLFLDLDRFKTINDTLGHAIGDQLLKQATQRLQATLREGDLIARWGGDEFTLILPRLHQPQDAAKLAQRIIDCFTTPFVIAEHELYVTSSVGIALYPDDGDNLHTLLQNADTALYRAKDQGRNAFQFYTANLNQQASERLQLESLLHHALAEQELEVWYQPQVNLQSGQVTKVEALLRWRHRDLGLISPAKFIPIAEETGLIIPIGAWILAAACRQAKAWHSLGLPLQRISVNLSARQFQQPDLVAQITKILAETGLSATQLELEITETAAMQNVDFTRRTLEELRDLGVQIAMDDFGTGYSSLNYLKRFPLNTLKIDQSFVRDLIHHSDDEAIVASIIALGKSFTLSVVAEGVETEAQAQRLCRLGCQEMQGYWFSRPIPADEMAAFLQRQAIVPDICAKVTQHPYPSV